MSRRRDLPLEMGDKPLQYVELVRWTKSEIGGLDSTSFVVPENVHKITVPMFVVQGDNDPRVPVTEAIQMVEALRKEGHTVGYMNALNEGHWYKKRENRDMFQQATVLFFKKHLVDD